MSEVLLGREAGFRGRLRRGQGREVVEASPRRNEDCHFPRSLPEVLWA